MRDLDLVILNTFIIKAATGLSDINIAQAKNYLQAGGIEIGLLINFGASSLQLKRMINNMVQPNDPKNLSK